MSRALKATLLLLTTASMCYYKVWKYGSLAQLAAAPELWPGVYARG